MNKITLLLLISILFLSTAKAQPPRTHYIGTVPVGVKSDYTFGNAGNICIEFTLTETTNANITLNCTAGTIMLFKTSPYYSATSAIGVTNWNLNSGTYRYYVTNPQGNVPAIVCFLTFNSVSYPTGKNYIKKSSPRIAKSTISYNPSEEQITVQHFDGLGRPLQNVSVHAAPDGKDIVTPVAYDVFGRQDKNYLPYAATGANGSYRPLALTEQSSFYATPPTTSIPVIPNPFSQTVFEASPLNRPLEAASPGQSWAIGSGHTIRTGYEINDTNEVRLWNVNPSAPDATSSGHYSAGQLYKNITWDEHRNRVIEYKDKEGQVVCKKVQDGGDTLNAPTYMVTQYIYDDFNQLAYVIPPALESITSFTEADPDFLNYIYAYHYDGRRRLIEKKIPGKGWEYTVYNKGDRPIFTQDSLQRARGVWVFMKYDTLGRPIITGETSNASSRASLATLAGNQGRLYEIRSNTQAWGYTNTAIPAALSKIFTVNFYDDYSFLQSTVNPNPIPSLFTQPAGTATESSMTHGLPTITVTNVLDSSKYLYSVTYYDEKGRVSKTVSQHLLNGADVVTSTYNFVGEVTATTRKHYNNGNTTTPVVTIATANRYDHAGRILESIEKINTQAPDTTSYTYDAVGQLETKRTGNQTTGYAYNARGWLKKQTGSLFSMELKYDDASGNLAQFNGNIGQQLWKSSTGTQIQRSYSYAYDRANRLTSGTSDEGYNESGITYDKMGNIKTLTRPKKSATAITYNYGTSGNQLQSNSGGYARGYTYDGNGNVKTMTGTDPLTITYNVLNLPKQVTGSGTVSYAYDAAGNKLKKTTAIETRWYIGGIEYYTNSTTPTPVIDLLHTATGVARRSGTAYIYEYFLIDHLGNTRIVHNKAGTVLQQTDYYPFGMSIARTGYLPNKYMYNGKERQQEFGGSDDGQYDYGARFYDPQIGRWHVSDPLASQTPSISPYTYVMNNPLILIDPDGRKIGGDTAMVSRLEYQAGRIIHSEEQLQSRLQKRIDKREAKGKSVSNLNRRMLNSEGRVQELTSMMSEVGELRSSSQMYNIVGDYTPPLGINIDGEMVYNPTTGAIDVNISSNYGLAGLAHELKHAYQYEKGYTDLKIDGSGRGYLHDLTDETFAFRRQYAFDPRKFAVANSIFDINPNMIRGLNPQYSIMPSVSLTKYSTQKQIFSAHNLVNSAINYSPNIINGSVIYKYSYQTFSGFISK